MIIGSQLTGSFWSTAAGTLLEIRRRTWQLGAMNHSGDASLSSFISATVNPWTWRATDHLLLELRWAVCRIATGKQKMLPCCDQHFTVEHGCQVRHMCGHVVSQLTGNLLDFWLRYNVFLLDKCFQVALMIHWKTHLNLLLGFATWLTHQHPFKHQNRSVVD